MSEHIRIPRRGRPRRNELYRCLDMQISELWQGLGGLPSPLEASDIWRGIWFEEAHHSTAIEGNTLVLKQVEALLADGRAVGSRELREYMEVRGYADAADWVYRQAISPGDRTDGSTLNLTEFRQVHKMAMTPRGTSTPIEKQRTAKVPVAFESTTFVHSRAECVLCRGASFRPR